MYISESMATKEALRLAGDTLPEWAQKRLEYADDLRGNHPSVEERINHLESLLDEIAASIVRANWRTGKKAELQELIAAIEANTNYSKD